MSAPSPTPEPGRRINRAKFYGQYKGHPLEDLALFREITVAERPAKPIVWLAGDSSLDNKYWTNKTIGELGIKVPSIYEKTLNDPRPKVDVAFRLNEALGERATCINTAVEESMIRERDNGLQPHDEFIRDNIGANDVLIVSVGSNDVANEPLFWTVINMVRLAWLTSRKSLEDDSASALQYFKNLYGTKVEEYITKMTSKTKPRAVIVCMIYYPLEMKFEQKSWADWNLKLLGYGSYPGQLQAATRSMYRIATKQIKVNGTEIVPFALYDVLDGQNAEDYVERVEPSEEGGKKMAVKFAEVLNGLFLSPWGGASEKN
jgi:hypothetical protein